MADDLPEGETRSEPVVRLTIYPDGTTAIETAPGVPDVMAAQALIEAANRLLERFVIEALSA